MAEFVFRSRDKAALNWIDDCIQQDDAVRKPLEPQWWENWANYRVESIGGQGDSKRYPLSTGSASQGDLSPINFLKSPEGHQGINTIRALLLAGLYGTRDYVQADPVGDEDVEKAKKVSRLVMFGLERPGNFRTNWETLGDSLIFGLGSYSARWKRTDRLVPRRMPVPHPTNEGEFLKDPNTGSVMTVLEMVMQPIHDDPTLETDDLFDTWFDSSANRFDQVKHKVVRFKIRDEELKTLKNDKDWDADGIGRVLESEPGGSAVGPDAESHPKLITENLTQEDVKDVAKYGYYGGWMFEGMIPKEVADEINEGTTRKIDHLGAVVLRMVNGILIQAIQSPQRNGQIQGGTITILPTGRGLYGLSPLTVVRYLLDVNDTQLILTVQAMIEAVYQNYLVGGGLGPNFAHQLETRQPREVFTMEGEVTDVSPLPKDYTGLQIASGALNLISQTIRNAMNARDPIAGVQRQSGEQTATESNLVASAALQNTDQLAVLIERDELPPQGRLINDLYYVNLEDEGKVFRRVGDLETTPVNYFDIDAVTDINFVGARSLLSKQGKSNAFRDFTQMILSNPFTAAAMDWHGFIARFGDEVFDVKGLEQFMITDPDEVVARMQAAGLANTVQPASNGGAGSSGGSPQAKTRRTPSSGGKSGGNTSAQSAGEAT